MSKDLEIEREQACQLLFELTGELIQTRLNSLFEVDEFFVVLGIETFPFDKLPEMLNQI